jgi:Uma2 family endonuclease
MTKNPPHCAAIEFVRDCLTATIPSDWSIRIQDPITLAASEPEPDLAVVKARPSRYADRHPLASEVALIVEVAGASIQRDREWKRRIFADAGIPVYWIVDLTGRQVEVYSDPSGPVDEPDYRRGQVYAIAEELPVVIAGQEVGRLAVRDLLPTSA